MERINSVDVTVHSARNVRRLTGDCKCATSVTIGEMTRTSAYVKGDDILVELSAANFSFKFCDVTCDVALICKPASKLRNTKVVGVARVPLKDIYDTEVKENGVTKDGASTARTPARWYALKKNQSDNSYCGEVLLSFQFDTATPQALTSQIKSKTFRRFSTRITDALKSNKSNDHRLGRRSSIEEGIISVKPLLGTDRLKTMPVNLKLADWSPDKEDSVDVEEACSSRDDALTDSETLPIREASVPPWVRTLCKLSPKESDRRLTLPRRPTTEWAMNQRQHDEAVLETLTRDALLTMIKEQRQRLIRLETRCSDLEDYIDAILARVMDSKPDILAQHPKIGTLRLH